MKLFLNTTSLSTSSHEPTGDIRHSSTFAVTSTTPEKLQDTRFIRRSNSEGNLERDESQQMSESFCSPPHSKQLACHPSWTPTTVSFFPTNPTKHGIVEVLYNQKSHLYQRIHFAEEHSQSGLSGLWTLPTPIQLAIISWFTASELTNLRLVCVRCFALVMTAVPFMAVDTYRCHISKLRDSMTHPPHLLAKVPDPSALLYLERHHSLRHQRVAAGVNFSMLCTKRGEVYSWGDGLDGRLGHDDETSVAIPTKIRGLRSKRVLAVSCGDRHSACICSEGTVYTWGDASLGKLGHGKNQEASTPTPVKFSAPLCAQQVACGGTHTMVLATDRHLWVTGSNIDGQLGIGERYRCVWTPQRVAMDANVSQVAGGRRHSLMISLKGEVFSCGNNAHGQLGLGENPSADTPTRIDPSQFHNKAVVSVAAGGFHSAAVTVEGSVYTFGRGNYGQLGHNKGNPTSMDSRNPQLVDNLPNAKKWVGRCVAVGTTLW
eukprot:Platyproteum_vivax@DN5735_c0_g1_i1.p1